MKISVAMATFNGGRFIEAQLKSILNQTIPPDEIVICDDGSVDCTIERIEETRASSPIEILLHRNPQRLGFALNFEKALSLCQGEIIFLSDQDDLWLEHKVEEICKVFLRNPTISLVVANSFIGDEDAHPIGATSYQRLAEAKIPYSLLAQGSAMAIRRTLRDKAIPFPRRPAPDIELSHDTWLSILASVANQKMVIGEVLQIYRRHRDVVSVWELSSLSTSSYRQRLFRMLTTDPRPGLKSRIFAYEMALARIKPDTSNGDGRMKSGVENAAFSELRKQVLKDRNRLDFLSCSRWKRFTRVALNPTILLRSRRNNDGLSVKDLLI